MDHGPWETPSLRVATLSQAIQFRTTGVGQAQELGHLVETFPSSVVHGPTEHSMLLFRFNKYEQSVPATDDQRHIGNERHEICVTRFAADPWRVKVRFVVMNAQERLRQRKSKRLPCLEADQQGGW